MEETRLSQGTLLCRAAYSNKSTTWTRHGSNLHLRVERRALCAQGTFLYSLRFRCKAVIIIITIAPPHRGICINFKPCGRSI